MTPVPSSTGAADPGVAVVTAEQNRFTRRLAASACVVAVSLGASGCGLTSLIGQGTTAAIAVLPFDEGPRNTHIHQPLKVIAENGRLVAVRVTGPDGRVGGWLSRDKSQWTSRDASLDYGARYQVHVLALDEDGREFTQEYTHRTMEPKQTNSAWLAYVNDGDEMGVGMPLRVEFSEAVTNRALVEKALEVRTSRRILGAWSWDEDGKAVTFRPRDFWPAYTRVQLVAGLRGIPTSAGVYGKDDFTAEMTIGSRMIAEVDAGSLVMTVKKDDEVIETIPVTTGKYGFETREGIKPIMAKEGTVVMDAATGGTSRNSSEYYRLTVHDSMRLTWSGEYVHAAPWSTGSQGRSRVSHGCIGMSSYAADWFYDVSRVGDVVTVTNTGRDSEMGNGITDWMVDWKDWIAGSETGKTKTTVSLKPVSAEGDEAESDEA